jgi:two-component system, OmpR family, phosphate regulon sensor histidine kinase PhoR
LKLGIRSKLFLISLALVGIAVIAAEAYLSRALEKQLRDRIASDLVIRARLLAERFASTGLRLEDANAIDALADNIGPISGARVTLVRIDGTVSGDSEVDTRQLARLENHAARPEIVEALAHGQGLSVRYSTTIGRDMMYVAVPVIHSGETIGAARIAVPLTEIDAAILQMRRSLAFGALFALGIAVVISLSAAQLTSRKLLRVADVARKMAGGDLTPRSRLSGSDEIIAVGQALDQLAENLSRTLGELQGERDLLNRVLSSMNEGVLVVSGDGRIVLMNPALRAMLLIGQEATGKSVLQVVRNADLNQLIETAAKRQDAELELGIGGLRPRRVLVRATKLRDAAGGVLAVFVDVTELRRLETVRRDFVTNASHELRSPLTSIRAAAETLTVADNDAETARRFAELIQKNADRLANLVDDLLELSRIESRELNLQLEPIDPGVVAERVVAQHAHRAHLKRIVLTHDLTGAPLVRADRRALEHVLGNLVDNAVKYCSEGAAVHVSAGAENGLVRVSVSDTGSGIAPEHLSRLFERFYRVDAGRSRELGGTGLGLSIVKHLVEAMGGTASVESRVGAGSTFSFTLQRA